MIGTVTLQDKLAHDVGLKVREALVAFAAERPARCSEKESGPRWGPEPTVKIKHVL
jgi:hypothetical protein